MTTELSEAAERYLAQGVNIIPTRDKNPALPRWVDFQTRFATDTDLRLWRTVLTNVTGLAAVTGKLSGIVVVDVDDVNVMHLYDLPETVKATSGRGIHLYYSYPDDVSIKTLSGFRPMLDVKANGGLITLPPSLHVATGKKYQWVVPFARESLAVLPQWIINELKEIPLPHRTLKTPLVNGKKLYRRVGNPRSKNYATPQMIEEARLVPIEEVAEEHTTLKRGSTDRLVGLCPLHDEKTPSFTIYLKTNTFYCFGCSKHGDVITLLQALEKLSFGQAVRNLYDRP